MRNSRAGPAAGSPTRAQFVARSAPPAVRVRCALRWGGSSSFFQQVRQCRSAHGGKAENPQTPFGQIVRGQNRHDVCVLKPGQRPMLAAAKRAHFEHDRSVCQLGLCCKVNPPLGPPSEPGH